MMKFVLSAVTAITLVGCGIVGPKIDFYDASVAAKDPNTATVSGSRTDAVEPLSPILVFLDSIDQKATARAKEARCKFNYPYPISPVRHQLLAVLSVGRSFAEGRFALVPIEVDAAPKAKLILKGEVYSANDASVWVVDESGKMITNKIKAVLKDSPSKGMPIGFSMIDEICL